MKKLITTMVAAATLTMSLSAAPMTQADYQAMVNAAANEGRQKALDVISEGNKYDSYMNMSNRNVDEAAARKNSRDINELYNRGKYINQNQR